MRLLLDTHVFLWWLTDDRKLSQRLRKLIGKTDSEVLVSSICLFEITTKFVIGKLPGVASIIAELSTSIDQAGFEELPLTAAHATRAGLLPNPRRDPFDRLLAAQALVEGLPIVSVDQALDSFMVERIA